MPSSSTGFPSVPQVPLIGRNGLIDDVWYQFFVSLFTRTGGATGSPSLVLDLIGSVPGSLLYRAAQAWLTLPPAAQFRVLRMGAAFPEWDVLDGNSFGVQGGSNFFVAPTAGGVATFRQVVTADLSPIKGQFPGSSTNDAATAGNVAEFISAQVNSGAAVNLTSATPADITSINLTPGDWDVWADAATAPAGATTTSIIRAWVNTQSATDPNPPNGGAYLLSQQNFAAGLAQVAPVGRMRLSLSANTTAFLSINATFAAGTMGAYGFLGARRAR